MEIERYFSNNISLSGVLLTYVKYRKIMDRELIQLQVKRNNNNLQSDKSNILDRVEYLNQLNLNW